jgi:hypothetical protein
VATRWGASFSRPSNGRVVVTRMVGLARMRTMSDESVVPDQEATAEGYTVFWEPAHYPADDIEG